MAGFFSGVNLGTLLSGATTIFTNAGVTGATQTTAINQLGGLFSGLVNPNYNAELTLASQIMQFAGNPNVEEELANKLVTEQGLPPAAATIAANIAKNVLTPGYNPTPECLEIEQIIRSGG